MSTEQKENIGKKYVDGANFFVHYPISMSKKIPESRRSEISNIEKSISKSLIFRREFGGNAATDIAKILGVTRQAVSARERKPCSMSLMSFFSVLKLYGEDVRTNVSPFDKKIINFIDCAKSIIMEGKNGMESTHE